MPFDPLKFMIDAVKTAVGNIASLKTQTKTNCVSAINEVSDQIGNVALPTTAQTLTGAIAENHGQISSIINNLDGFKIKNGGVNPNNWNNLFTSTKSITFYDIFGSSVTGAPTGAYSYGLLIVISNDNNNWDNVLVYISDLYSTNNSIYLKTKGRNSWLKLTGTLVNDVS